MRLLTSGIYLVLIFIFPFFFILKGIHFTDEPYQILCMLQLIEPDVLSFLHPVVGKVLSDIFPGRVVDFRILAYLMQLLIFAAPVVYLLRKKLDSHTLLFWIAFSVILHTSRSSYMISPYTLSTLIKVLILLFAYAWMKHQERGLLLLLGILSAVNMAFRFPEILTIGIIGIFITMIGQMDGKTALQRLWDVSIYLISAILCYLVMYMYVMDIDVLNTSNIFFHITEGIREQQTFSQSHSTFNLLKSYVKDSLVLGIIIACFSLFLYIILRNKKNKFVYFAIYVIVLVTSMTANMTTYGTGLSLMFSALFLIASVFLLYNKSLETKENIWVVLLIIVAFITSAGSSTGFLKLSYCLLPFLPVILVELHQHLSASNRRIVMNLVVSFMVCLPVAKIGFGRAYEDGAFLQLRSQVNHAKLEGLYTTKARKKRIEHVIQVVDSIKKISPERKILYYGGDSWLYYVLSETALPSRVSFRMPVDQADHCRIVTGWLRQDNSQPYLVLIGESIRRKMPLPKSMLRDSLIALDYSVLRKENGFAVFEKIKSVSK